MIAEYEDETLFVVRKMTPYPLASGTWRAGCRSTRDDAFLGSSTLAKREHQVQGAGVAVGILCTS